LIGYFNGEKFKKLKKGAPQFASAPIPDVGKCGLGITAVCDQMITDVVS